jgi:CARDB protein
MFSSYSVCGLFRRLLLAGLLTACQASSSDLQGPGGPDSLEPDLSPGPIQTPARIRLDALLQMSVGVRNVGSLTAGPGWVVRVVISTDSQIDDSDQQIDQFVATRELPPGGEDVYLRNKKLSGVVAEDYFIGSILDVTGTVPETSETNNALTTPGRLTLTPPGSDH